MASTCASPALPGAFVVTVGGCAGRVIRFAAPGIPLIFGRAGECGVQFTEASISRIHACAACIGETYVVSDAGSRNGTFVNGRRIDTATALEHGDLVTLGSEIGLRFCLGDAEEDTGLIPVAETDDRDRLTGLFGRVWLEDAIDAEIRKARGSCVPLSVMMIEVDRLQELIDLHGPAARDELVVGLARVVRSAIRNTDVPGRYGSEELLVMAPCTPLEDAYWVAERIRSEVRAAAIAGKSLPFEITVSIGVASLGCCGPLADRTSLLFLAHQRTWLAANSRDAVVSRGGDVSALIRSVSGESTMVSPS